MAIETRSLMYRQSKKRPVLFYSTEGLIEALDKISNVYGVSRSLLIREAILRFIDKESAVMERALP